MRTILVKSTATPAQLERAVRRDFCAPFAIKAVDEAARTFTGLASTWEQDLGMDVVHKGAFRKTLTEWRKAKGRPVPLLDGHDRFSVLKVLGKLQDANETDEGLEAQFGMVPNDPDAEAAMRRVKGGFVTGLSIGYTPVEFTDEPVPDGRPWERVRHLKEVRLHEISLVVFPMNDGARVDPSSVKSLLDAARAGQLTDADKAELLALLTTKPAEPTPVPAPGTQVKELAPDDPARLAMEDRLREIVLRSVAA